MKYDIEEIAGYIPQTKMADLVQDVTLTRIAFLRLFIDCMTLVWWHFFFVWHSLVLHDHIHTNNFHVTFCQVKFWFLSTLLTCHNKCLTVLPVIIADGLVIQGARVSTDIGIDYWPILLEYSGLSPITMNRTQSERGNRAAETLPLKSAFSQGWR